MTVFEGKALVRIGRNQNIGTVGCEQTPYSLVLFH